MKSIEARSSMQKAIILTIVSNLAIGAVLCAPSLSSSSSQAPPLPASAATSSSQANQPSNGNSQSAATKQSAAATLGPADRPQSNLGQFSSAASTVGGSPSIVNLRQSLSAADVGASSSAVQRSHADEMDGGAFDGKNPFADDSLWQIPINLVRDLSAGNGGEKDTILARSTNSELSNADENDHDDDDSDSDQAAPPANSGSTNSNARPLSASSSPAVISASTTADLKTAAGYHYPSSHEHHHGGGYDGDHHESLGHHGGHYGSGAGHHHGAGNHYGGAGDHYGGKYFQYASVPYPGAWEFGYRRGNPYHTIERYEHGKGPHFKTKVKWSDKHGGYGVHVWDYNHDDHHSHHYGGGHYDSHAPAHHGSAHYGGHHEGHYGHH